MEAFTSNPHIFQLLCVIFKEKVDKKKTLIPGKFVLCYKILILGYNMFACGNIRKTHNSFGERKNLFKYEGSF